MAAKMKKRTVQQELKNLNAIEVTNFVSDKFLASEKRNLSSLNQCFQFMSAQDLRNYPELPVIRNYFNEIRSLLQKHLSDSETIFFPAIRKNDSAAYDFSPLQDQLRSIHEELSRLFLKIQGLTNNYTPPALASGWMKLCYALLHDLEADAYSHLFVEESILPLKLGA